MSVAVLGPLCAFMSSVTWALGSAGYSRMARDHSAFAVNLARGLVALPLFLLTALAAAALQTHSWSGALSAFDMLEARHFGWFGLSMLASYGLGDSIFLMSSRAIGIPAALTIASSYPLLTASWGALVHHEWLSVAQTIGLLITVIGVALVILSAPKLAAASQSNESEAPSVRGLSRSTGILFAFIASVCWATNSYCVTRGGQGIPVPVGNTIRMAAAVLLCLTIGKIAFPKDRLTLPLSVYRRWMWLFVLEAFGGSYFFLFGLSHSPLAIGSTLASLAPVISVPVALALRLETFSWKRTAAVITVVLGLFLLVGGLHS
jgi:drug/metabolite transporter (DMT)-like permease